MCNQPDYAQQYAASVLHFAEKDEKMMWYVILNIVLHG